MTNRQIRRYNAANRQGHTMTQTVFFHLALGALAGLIPFAIALILTF
jgi:cytochrome b subunit of formate dehydrogenase